MGALLDAARAQQSPVLERLLVVHAARPPHFQDHLPDLLRGVAATQREALVVVETGVSAGVSTDWILTTLDELGAGRLISIDPSPMPGLFEIEHPRWRKLETTSAEALEHWRVLPPWDVFLHDSDHAVYCETFEYEAAWHFVRAGGLILSDDYDWGTPPHGAWRKFCDRHELAWHTRGACAVAQKPIDARVLASGGFAAAKAVAEAAAIA